MRILPESYVNYMVPCANIGLSRVNPAVSVALELSCHKGGGWVCGDALLDACSLRLQRLSMAHARAIASVLTLDSHVGCISQGEIGVSCECSQFLLFLSPFHGIFYYFFTPTGKKPLLGPPWWGWSF